ncbi:MAG: type IV pilus modification protein PilV [Burkholderiales bacterium]
MKQELGFTMLEILVSMIVIMIGVLGIAGMQMLSINNTEIARYQSLAALSASGIAAKMQANPAYWVTPATNTITINGTSVGSGPAAGNCLNAVCSPTQLAGYDLQNFGQMISSVLPSGQATITCTTAIATPTVCALQLNWLEKNVALNNPSSTNAGNIFSSGTENVQSYQTEVSIK